MIQNRPPIIVNGKVTLLWLLNRYGISMISLAHRSNIQVEVIHRMIKGEVVGREQAERLLHALSRVAGIRYTLRDVHIKIGGADDHRTS